MKHFCRFKVGFAVLVVSWALPVFAQTADLNNLRSDFIEFLKQVDAVPSERYADQFYKSWDVLESKHQEILDAVSFDKDDPQWKAKRQKKLLKLLETLPQIRKPMIELFEKADVVVQNAVDRFVKYFPDLQDRIPVYIMPSAFSFNGRVTCVPNSNRAGLFLGVDFIAYRNDNLTLLFSHEFFHVYHSSKLEDSDYESLAFPLWEEGFATYMSGIMNPSATDSEILMDEDLAKFCSNPGNLARIAGEYLKLLNDNAGEEAYADWFSASSGTTKPTRRGYCLGLKVIRAVAAKTPLTEMINWHLPQFDAQVRRELVSLSTQETVK